MSKKQQKGGANLPAAPKKAEQAQALSLEQVLAHPVVKQMSAKLEEMRALVAGLPEAVGRAVAAHQASAKAQPMSAPVMPLKASNDGVEFHKKGKIIQDGKVIAEEGLMDRRAIPISARSLEVPLAQPRKGKA